ncbi:MAG: phage portal protein [Flavobacteriaceae bacterium TMED238]|nr:MAG: phage portal protein [Flavobacteriaceae bacterium TMED238]|tara:strand:+ start:974 stop:2713 length:1740 start_codon:yes stop_codon:yes gene_type:complete
MSKNLKIINLGGYEIPKVIENKRHNWVEYGENNQYFDEIIERYLGSATNSRCVNGIVDMIYGRGLDATDSQEKAEMFGKMQSILQPDQLKRIVNDLKLLGQASIQVTYDKKKSQINGIYHFPTETLRAEKAKDGKVKGYYYHPKWSEIKPNDKPKRIPAFGYGSKKELIEIYCVKPYRPGFYYYSPVDYQGCLQYCNLEEEVSNYHIQNIKNGLQPSMLLNFNNGVPGDEAQEIIERKIYDKFSGSSNAGRFILAFNEDAETQASVEPINLPDAHAQYDFLAKESREKIMIGHGVVSPILLGIKDNTGFGNNAEELRTASILMDNIVIRPFQALLIDSLKSILAFNEIYLNLYFVTLQPIEFTELDNIATKIKREEETGEKLSSDVKIDLNDDEADDLMSQLETLGEKIDENQWELVHQEIVEDSDKDFDLETFSNQASKSDANPNKESYQDNATFKVRYSYTPIKKSINSRKFCISMENLAEQGVVFRKEDINMMSFRGLNKELGHKGQRYSLFKYKGGVNCQHKFMLNVYKKKVKQGDKVSIGKAKEDGFKEPTNPKEYAIAPKDMPNQGHHPNYNK